MKKNTGNCATNHTNRPTQYIKQQLVSVHKMQLACGVFSRTDAAHHNL